MEIQFIISSKIIRRPTPSDPKSYIIIPFITAKSIPKSKTFTWNRSNIIWNVLQIIYKNT